MKLFGLRLLSGCLSGGSGLSLGLGLLGAAAASGLLSLFLRGSESGLVEVNELDQGHVGTVTKTETGVKDAGVSARTISDLRGDDTEQLLDSLFVLEVAEHSTAGVSGILLGLGDKRLHVCLQGLSLGDGGLDPLVLDKGASHVRQHCLAVAALATKVIDCFIVPHF